MRLLILLVLLPMAAWADCAMFSWNVFPEAGSKVPKNSRFVVQGYGDAQPFVQSIATRKPRLVTPKGAQVALRVVEINVGEKDLTQAILEPTAPLSEGTRYTLKFETTGQARFTLGDDKRASWIAGAADLDPPRWTTAPSALPGVIQQFGCGPAIQARVSLAIDDASATQVLAKVSREGGATRQYLLPPRDGRLVIGHGMCSGAFQFGEEEWSLELFAVDAAGNTAPAPGAPLRFKGVEPK